MISSAPSPKTMSFNAIGAKDSLEKKRLAKVLMPPLRGNKWAAKRGFIDDDCRGLAMFETSICGVERKVSPCLSQLMRNFKSKDHWVGLYYFNAFLFWMGCRKTIYTNDFQSQPRLLPTNVWSFVFSAKLGVFLKRKFLNTQRLFISIYLRWLLDLYRVITSTNSWML